MWYYFFVIIADVGILLWEHKFTISLPLFGAICWAIGKRHGVKFAVTYIMKTFRLEKKSIVEQQIEHHEKEIVKLGGQPWIAPISKPYRLNIRRLLLKRSIWSRVARSIARFVARYTNLRGKKRMDLLKSNLSKKLVVTITATLLIAMNDKFALGMTQETIYVIAGVVATYVAGQAHVDAKKQESAQFH